MAGDRRVLVLASVGTGLIAWREVKAPTGILPNLPNPAAFSGPLVLYGLVSLLSEIDEGFAIALAVGWTLYLVYDHLNGGGSIGPARIERTATRVDA